MTRPKNQGGRTTAPGTSAPAPRRGRRQRRQFWYAIVASIAILGLVGGAIAASIVGGSTTTDHTTSTSSTTTPTPSTIAPSVDVAAPPPGEAVTGETPCPAADGSAARTTSFENPPPMCIDPARTYRAIIETTEGPITVLLNPEQAPQTVNNFVVLSRYHYYDDVPFFVIDPQAAAVTGDATGDPLGTGGPGYGLDDEIPEAGVIYPWGTLAMFDSVEGEGSDGSMFLIATGERATALPPTFTTFGQVLDGEDPVQALNESGDPATGAPIREVRIESVTIIEE